MPFERVGSWIGKERLRRGRGLGQRVDFFLLRSVDRRLAGRQAAGEGALGWTICCEDWRGRTDARCRVGTRGMWRVRHGGTLGGLGRKESSGRAARVTPRRRVLCEPFWRICCIAGGKQRSSDRRWTSREVNFDVAVRLRFRFDPVSGAAPVGERDLRSLSIMGRARRFRTGLFAELCLCQGHDIYTHVYIQKRSHSQVLGNQVRIAKARDTVVSNQLKYANHDEIVEHSNPPASIQGRNSFLDNNTPRGVSQAEVRVAFAPQPANNKGK